MPIEAHELRDTREGLGLTQLGFAELAGVSIRSVVNWERTGSRVPARQEIRVHRAIRNARETQGGTEQHHPPADAIAVADATTITRRRALRHHTDIELLDELRDRAIARQA